MLPHDYYDDQEMMRLHAYGNGSPYLEKDLLARETDDQLPLLSTVGRGPRGIGLKIANLKTASDTFSFDVVDDEGNVLASSGNLSAGEFSFSRGENGTLTITKTKGGVKSSSQITLPKGDRGSLIFISEKPIAQGTVGVLAPEDIDGNATPSSGDVILAPTTEGGVSMSLVMDVSGNDIAYRSFAAAEMPKVSVGKTTTLPAGSDATVVNSGDNRNIVLDFGIPKGVDGDGAESDIVFIDLDYDNKSNLTGKEIRNAYYAGKTLVMRWGYESYSDIWWNYAYLEKVSLYRGNFTMRFSETQMNDDPLNSPYWMIMWFETSVPDTDDPVTFTQTSERVGETDIQVIQCSGGSMESGEHTLNVYGYNYKFSRNWADITPSQYAAVRKRPVMLDVVFSGIGNKKILMTNDASGSMSGVEIVDTTGSGTGNEQTRLTFTISYDHANSALVVKESVKKVSSGSDGGSSSGGVEVIKINNPLNPYTTNPTFADAKWSDMTYEKFKSTVMAGDKVYMMAFFDNEQGMMQALLPIGRYHGTYEGLRWASSAEIHPNTTYPSRIEIVVMYIDADPGDDGKVKLTSEFNYYQMQSA